MTLAAPSVTPSSATSATPPIARPAFHLAPIFLEAPSDIDRINPMNSASKAPHRVPVDPALASLSTRRLTPQVLRQVRETGTAADAVWVQGSAADPLVTAATAVIYTPAQIRAAYGLPGLPNTSASVTSAQAAQMGAGQTIYIVDAQDDPNLAVELASFDAQFGLPPCTVTAIATTASLPLSAAPATGCTLSIVYSDPTGAMSATAPGYLAGWATEIALDVQWAHATAPYARIILIEGADSSFNSLTAAVGLANRMGSGVVSQSFGANESGSWVNNFDALYSVAGMTYLAATGDAGAGVEFPAVSSRVLAVAGTSLSYSGGGARSETVWSGTGGGVSAYMPTPTYQTLAVPGLGAPAHRAVSDVTFNADPYTGQYVAVIAKNNANVWQSLQYYSVGGTSLATPQWAGLIAVANALRSQNALAPIGAAQPTLYGLGAQAASYAGAFLDVTTGSDGSCATCDAGVGYDLPSGLGSPNAAALLLALSGQAPVAAPVVSSATVTGRAEVAFSFSITATAAHSLTYSLSGAPAGMSVNAGTGLVTWSAPILGTYSVIANAYDAQTGLSGQGTLSVTIATALPPQVAGGAVSGIAQTPLTFAAQVAHTGVLTYSLSSAPYGMSVSAAGVVNWPSPVVGNYAVTVIALDPASGLTGQGIYAIAIAPAGSAPITVPNEVGLTQAAASASLTNAGITDVYIVTIPNGCYAVGTVIDQTPVAGSVISASSSETLTVASAAANVNVPNVVGDPSSFASTVLANLGFTTGTVTQASSSAFSAGIVIAQTPAAGSAGSCLSVSLVVSSGAPPVIVPNEVNSTQITATSAFAFVNLVLGSVTQQSSSTVAQGFIISQSPAGGTSVAVGTAVNLVVSSGPAQVTVPNEVNSTQAAAASAFAGVKLNLGIVMYQSSSTVAQGFVLSQSPAGGTIVAAGSAVNVIVSSGSPPVNVPNEVNNTQAAAASAFASVRLALGSVTSQASTSVAQGSVISQVPVGGTSVAVGTPVSIVVSSGKPKVTVPGEVGATQAAAVAALHGAGLAVGTLPQQTSTSIPAGSVISETPVAGSLVASGSTVSLVVSSGRPPNVQVPHEAGMTQAAATSAFNSAKLTLGLVTSQASTSVAQGYVISQSPAGGTSVAVGTAVNLVVSSGKPKATVPREVGATQTTAVAALHSAGLVAGAVTQQSSTSIAAGDVISQSPVAGSSVASGSPVSLVVSSGRPLVSVPNEAGLTQAKATTALTAQGLVLGSVTSQKSATVAAGKVVSQSPTAGAAVAAGSKVNLVLSSG